MHVLYVHQNFPAQFGHVAHHLVAKLGHRCTFVSTTPAGTVGGIEKVQYKVGGGATKQNHFCARTFENAVWHCDGVYAALKARPDVKPDLIVGHSGFGSTLFLPELYPDVPVVNLFEYYYRPHHPDSDMDYRRDLGWTLDPVKYLRSRCRNAMILLDLQACARGYTPTRFQQSCFPDAYRPKLDVIFDGIDRSVYHGFDDALRPPPEKRGPREAAGVRLPAGAKVVTYVSRGFESMRGFDLFMRAAKRVAQDVPEAVFIVVGTDQMPYGGDETYVGPHKSFKAWVLAREERETGEPFDLSRMFFVGRVPPTDLARVLAASDVHVYLTVPFVLSWSMMDAMSCGAVVVGSDTPPVREMIRDGETGLLADFFDPEAIAAKVTAVLRDLPAHRPLGRAAERLIAERYSLDAVLPDMLRLYDRALAPAT